MTIKAPEDEEWDIAVAAVGEGDAELWAKLVNACRPGESVLAMLKRTSTPVVNIEDALS